MKTPTNSQATAQVAYTFGDVSVLPDANLAAASLLSLYETALKQLPSPIALESAISHLAAITSMTSFTSDDATKIRDGYENGQISVHRCQECGILFLQNTTDNPQHPNCMKHR